MMLYLSLGFLSAALFLTSINVTNLSNRVEKLEKKDVEVKKDEIGAE